MSESRAVKVETLVVVVPANVTVDEIRAGVERNKALKVSRITQVGGAPFMTTPGRVLFEDTASPISGRHQGEGFAVYQVVVLADVRMNFISEATERAKRQEADRIKKAAEIAAKEKAALIAQKKAELEALEGPKPKEEKKEEDDE